MIAVFQYCAATLTWMFLKVFTKLEIIGLENLDKLQKPFLVVANHESHLDPQLVGVTLLQRPGLLPLRYMTKDAFFFYPGFNLLIVLLGAFRAYKKRGIMRSLRIPLHILGNKGAVIMFPEGKMVIERPKLGEGRRGAAMLGIMTRCTIVPMSLHTPHDLPPIPIFLRRHRVVIRIGQPFLLTERSYPSYADLYVNKATQEIMQKIGNLYYQHEYDQ